MITIRNYDSWILNDTVYRLNANGLYFKTYFVLSKSKTMVTLQAFTSDEKIRIRVDGSIVGQPSYDKPFFPSNAIEVSIRKEAVAKAHAVEFIIKQLNKLDLATLQMLHNLITEKLGDSNATR